MAEPETRTRGWTAHRGRLLGAVAGLIALVALFYSVDEGALHAWAGQLNGVVIFVALVLLPLVGFPVMLLHVAVGVRFGTAWGMLLVVVSIFLQLVASHALVHARHDAFARRFDALRRRVPRGAHRPVTLFTVLLPGVPYFAKNYVLVLLGVPLGTLLRWAFPVHCLRSAVAVVFGDQSAELTPWRLGGFVAYGVIVAAACAWSFVRLRAQLHPPATTPEGETARP